MKEKLTSRKFWVAVLSNIISITVIFTEFGGTVGTIAGIIGVVSSSISYMISECTVDVARTKSDYEQIKQLIYKITSEIANIIPNSSEIAEKIKSSSTTGMVLGAPL